MKLEYVSDDNFEGTPLVRLYDFSAADVSELRRAFADLATESTASLELHNTQFIDPVNGCRLTLTVNRRDEGLTKIDEPATFRCALTSGTWDNIEGLTEPFTQPDGQEFQWLNATGIPLLLSVDGRW